MEAHNSSSTSGSGGGEGAGLGTGASVYAFVVFLVTWIMISPSKWPMFPLGRATSSLLGACLMLVAGIIPFQEAMDVVGHNMEVMALLFGLMIISFFLGKEGLYERLEFVFTWRCKTAFDMLARIVFLCGVLAALITNDAVCIFVTPLIVKMGRKYNLPAGPVLIALGTTANIGSAATITGNPQNALIAIKGNIGYADFAKYMAPIAMICLGLNLIFLYIMYYKQLKGRSVSAYTAMQQDPTMRTSLIAPVNEYTSVVHDDHLDEQTEGEGVYTPPAASDTIALNAVDPMMDTSAQNKVAHDPYVSQNGGGGVDYPNGMTSEEMHQHLDSLLVVKTPLQKKLALAAKVLTLLSGLGVFVALLVGVPIGLASFAGGMAVITFQAALLRYEPHHVVTREIDYGLLLFFAGLFICIECFNRTGYPAIAEEAIFGSLDLSSPLGVFVFVIAVVIASNTLSNVPAVLLIAPFIESLPPDLAFAYWVISAWVTTVGGNLTIIGSAANIIVAERAAALKFHDTGFLEFFKFGSWTTVFVLTAGCVPLYLLLVP